MLTNDYLRSPTVSSFRTGFLCRILNLSPSPHRFVQNIYLTCLPFHPCNTISPSPQSSVPIIFPTVLPRQHLGTSTCPPSLLSSGYEQLISSSLSMHRAIPSHIIDLSLLHTLAMTGRYIHVIRTFLGSAFQKSQAFSLVNYTIYTNLVVPFHSHSHNVYFTLFHSHRRPLELHKPTIGVRASRVCGTLFRRIAPRGPGSL